MVGTMGALTAAGAKATVQGMFEIQSDLDSSSRMERINGEEERLNNLCGMLLTKAGQQMHREIEQAQSIL